MATRSSKPQSMAVVNIGYQSFVMPTDAALKVVGLMAGVEECSPHFGGDVYLTNRSAEVGMTILKNGKVLPAKPEQDPIDLGVGE